MHSQSPTPHPHKHKMTLFPSTTIVLKVSMIMLAPNRTRRIKPYPQAQWYNENL